MKRTHTFSHRILGHAAVVAVGLLLSLGAGVTRAEDPYPPLDDAAQRIVDDAREQMYAIDFERQQAENGQWIASEEPAEAPVQQAQTADFDSSYHPE